MIYYAGKKTGLLDSEFSLEAFLNATSEEKFPSRNALYETPGLIDEFVKKNPYGWNQEDLMTAKGFKNFVSGEFFIVKYLKKHTIFLQEDIAYGVLSLGDLLEDMLGGQQPVYVEAVLLPYQGKIVYDGIILSAPLYFGSGYRSSINQSYYEAKSTYGIITELPFVKPRKKKENPADKLAFYMKNAKNREYYAYEIEKLLDRNPRLEGKYYWHWGKINSRNKKKWLKELGISDIHYAIVNDTIIAQAESEYQIKEIVKAMLPKDTLEWVFYFKV